MKVRIAVAIDDATGDFEACGSTTLAYPGDSARESLDEANGRMTRLVWVEAEIPDVPAVPAEILRIPLTEVK